MLTSPVGHVGKRERVALVLNGLPHTRRRYVVVTDRRRNLRSIPRNSRNRSQTRSQHISPRQSCRTAYLHRCHWIRTRFGRILYEKGTQPKTGACYPMSDLWCWPRRESVSLVLGNLARSRIATARSRLGPLHKEANRRDDDCEYDYNLNYAR
jgi:hypothetical protein